jgi:hypothetical protein
MLRRKNRNKKTRQKHAGIKIPESAPAEKRGVVSAGCSRFVVMVITRRDPPNRTAGRAAREGS